MSACSWCGGTDEDIVVVNGPHDLQICADCIAVCVAALGKQMIDPRGGPGNLDSRISGFSA